MQHHPNLLRQLLAKFERRELLDQPVPDKERSDDRYELLNKFQAVLRPLGYAGIVVLVDRVDEPHLVNGSVERMRDLLWPMFDNKFLKHPGIGFKLLLPIEVSYHLRGKIANSSSVRGSTNKISSARCNGPVNRCTTSPTIGSAPVPSRITGRSHSESCLTNRCRRGS